MRVVLLLLLFAAMPVANAWQLTVGEVTLNWNRYVTATFDEPFPAGVTPVVVLLTPGTRNAANDDPAVVRIHSVTNTGFEVAIVEPSPEDGRYENNGEVLSYLAVEPGVHSFPNGDIIEAGTVSTNAIQHGGGVLRPIGVSESWTTQGLSGGFGSAPALVGMPQTINNEVDPGGPPGNNDPSLVFVTMAIRNVGTTSFQTAVERSEVDENPFLVLRYQVQAETMGYIVMENGAAGEFVDLDGDDIAYESFRTGDNVRGWGNGCYQRPNTGFMNNYAAVPHAFASKNKHDGGDGGWIRRCSISTTQVGLAVDEDRSRVTEIPAERNHTDEDVGVLVFGEPFVAIIEPEPLLRKTVLVDNDPVNGGANPRAIPDAEVLYTIRVENLGNGLATNVRLDDSVPDNMDLYAANTENCGAVVFRDGTPASGLSCDAVNVSFDDGSGNYNHPAPTTGDGFDSAITDIRIEFSGAFLATTAAGVPSFEVDLRMRIR